MSFCAGLTKTAISTKRIVGAGYERVRSRETDAVGRALLHRHSPVRALHVMDTAAELRSHMRNAVAKSGATDPEQIRFLRHHMKKLNVKLLQKLYAKK